MLHFKEGVIKFFRKFIEAIHFFHSRRGGGSLINGSIYFSSSQSMKDSEKNGSNLNDAMNNPLHYFLECVNGARLLDYPLSKKSKDRIIS